jgi:purine-binding chemotaxis protein CheW
MQCTTERCVRRRRPSAVPDLPARRGGVRDGHPHRARDHPVRPDDHVPLMPSFVRGVINLRGAVVPVIDLQARFGRAAASARRPASSSSTPSATANASSSGLMVDAVSEVIDIPPTRSSRRRTSAARCGATSSRAWARSAAASSSSSSPTSALDVDEMAQLCERSQEAWRLKSRLQLATTHLPAHRALMHDGRPVVRAEQEAAGLVAAGGRIQRWAWTAFEDYLR